MTTPSATCIVSGIPDARTASILDWTWDHAGSGHASDTGIPIGGSSRFLDSHVSFTATRTWAGPLNMASAYRSDKTYPLGSRPSGQLGTCELAVAGYPVERSRMKGQRDGYAVNTEWTTGTSYPHSDDTPLQGHRRN